MRRKLVRLYALVKVHFAKEEEIYLPLLGNWVFKRMDRRIAAWLLKQAAL
jgi:hypothetical protein